MSSPVTTEVTALADGPRSTGQHPIHPLLSTRGANRSIGGAFSSSSVPLAPDSVVLTGGFPGADVLPVALLAQAYSDQLGRADVGVNVLQYHGPSGTDELRQWVAAHHDVAVERVTITNGALHSVSFAVEALVDAGDLVFVEDPVYPFALRLLKYFGAQVVSIPVDDDGLDVDVLEAHLRAGRRPKLIYTVPDFHNPSTVTLSAERRSRLVELAVTYGFVVVSDNPYSALRWAGDEVADFDVTSESVVRAGTFSKVFGPGLRVGWSITPSWLTTSFVQDRLSSDQHAGLLTQRVLESLVTSPGVWEQVVHGARAAYARRARVLHDSLVESLGTRVRTRLPDGGLFLWVHVPGVDTGAALDVARAAGLDFTAGTSFAPPDAQSYRDWARFSFSSADEAQLRTAASRFAAAVDAVTAL